MRNRYSLFNKIHDQKNTTIKELDEKWTNAKDDFCISIDANDCAWDSDVAPDILIDDVTVSPSYGLQWSLDF